MSMSWEEQCGRLVEANGQAFLTACQENVRAFQALIKDNPGQGEASKAVRALGYEQVRFWIKLGLKVQRLAEWEGEGTPRCLSGGEYLISCDCPEALVWKAWDQHGDGDHSDCDTGACEEAAAEALAQVKARPEVKDAGWDAREHATTEMAVAGEPGPDGTQGERV